VETEDDKTIKGKEQREEKYGQDVTEKLVMFNTVLQHLL
jgi:hypothetical protein